MSSLNSTIQNPIKQLLSPRTQAGQLPSKVVTPGSGQPIQVPQPGATIPQTPAPPLGNDKLAAQPPKIYDFQLVERAGSDAINGTQWITTGDSGLLISVPITLIKHRLYGIFFVTNVAGGVVVKASVVLSKNGSEVARLPVTINTNMPGPIASAPTVFVSANVLAPVNVGGAFTSAPANCLAVYITNSLTGYYNPTNGNFDLLFPHEFTGVFDTAKFNVDSILNQSALTNMHVIMAIESFA